MKIKEVKSKREKERYTHIDAEFQRKTWRDKKAFLSDQCKEIEENNRMGKSAAAAAAKSLSRVQLCVTPWTAALQAPPSLGFPRQELWSGLPFPSPMHESEK